MKRIMLIFGFGLMIGICSAQESGNASENHPKKEEESVKVEINSSNAASKNFNTNHIQLDKVQQIKSRMKGEGLLEPKATDVKNTDVKTPAPNSQTID